MERECLDPEGTEEVVAGNLDGRVDAHMAHTFNVRLCSQSKVSESGFNNLDNNEIPDSEVLKNC
jgi:hypothetical protein